MAYYKNKYCDICGKKINSKYNLCKECYYNTQEEKEQLLEDYQESFYNEDEIYKQKQLMTKSEREYYKILKFVKPKNSIIFPQVPLRSIIATPYNNKTSPELYRILDFVIFDREYFPRLAIEINGKEHYTKPYTMLRDESVENILEDANIPLLTIKDTQQESIETKINKIKNLLYEYLN